MIKIFSPGFELVFTSKNWGSNRGECSLLSPGLGNEFTR